MHRAGPRERSVDLPDTGYTYIVENKVIPGFIVSVDNMFEPIPGGEPQGFDWKPAKGKLDLIGPLRRAGGSAL